MKNISEFGQYLRAYAADMIRSALRLNASVVTYVIHELQPTTNFPFKKWCIKIEVRRHTDCLAENEVSE